MQKAIVKQQVRSYINIKKIYAEMNDVVTVCEVREHVAICLKDNGDWFPVNINKLQLL